jgi:hypothetical protein
MKGEMDVVFNRSAMNLDLVSVGINNMKKTIDQLGTTHRRGSFYTSR